MKKPPMCVQSNVGWCASYKKSPKYSDSVKTRCGHWVILPLGLQRRYPDCPECRKLLRLKP